MTNYSVLLLALLGVVVVAAGGGELAREAGALTAGLNVFGSVLIILLGLWMVTCAIECRKWHSENSSKS